MKILQLCHKMSFPLHDGGAYSLYHTALGLANQGSDVKILAINTPKHQVDLESIPVDFREKTKFECSWVDTRFNLFSALINLFTTRSYFVERFYSKQYEADLIRILSAGKFDIIQLEHLYMCLYLNTIRKFSRARVILRPQNVENQVWKSILKNKISPLKKLYLRIATTRLLKFEIEMANQVDGIIAISPDDADTFRTYAPGIPCVEVPIGFDFSRISAYNMNRQFDDFPVFYHLGSMDWFPNIEGITWFIKEVIPYIKAEYPDFIFRIAGKKMGEWFIKQQDRNLIVDQWVEESWAYHEDKAVMIVPLLSGGGLRAKIIEGMALGKTIISTSTGAAGIPYTDQENILIANKKEDFAVQIKKCRDSREFCQKTGNNAQRFAIENYDCNKTAGSMIRFYSALNECDQDLSTR